MNSNHKKHDRNCKAYNIISQNQGQRKKCLKQPEGKTAITLEETKIKKRQNPHKIWVKQYVLLTSIKLWKKNLSTKNIYPEKIYISKKKKKTK